MVEADRIGGRDEWARAWSTRHAYREMRLPSRVDLGGVSEKQACPFQFWSPRTISLFIADGGPISSYEQQQRLDGCLMERSEQPISGYSGI